MERKALIIANPNGGAWDYANRIYKRLIMKSDSFELGQISIRRFSDNEFKPRIEGDVRNRHCFFVHDSGKDPSEWIVELGLVSQIMRTSSAAEITNILPYLKWSRQDRKDASRTPITARLIPNLILPYANRIVSLEIHNPAIQGFYDPLPFDHLYASNTLFAYLKKNHANILDNLVVVSPDSGGGDRAKGFSKFLKNKEVIIGYKERGEGRTVEKLILNGDMKGKDVIIIDDILDSGATLISACNAARMGGARRVYAYCTHALFSKGTKDLTKEFDTILVGDTIPLNDNHNQIEVVPFDGLFAEAIYRIHEGKSLTELFQNQEIIDRLV